MALKWQYDSINDDNNILQTRLMVVDQRHTLMMERLQGRSSMVPARTHPKAVLNAEVDPGGPNRRP